MKLSRIQLIAFLMIVVAALTSCRDELCYNHFPTLSLSLDWEHEWERDYGMNHSVNWDASYHGLRYDALRPGMPEWVNIIRFSADGTRHEHFVGSDGDNIIVDRGPGQSLLLYNGDTEYIILSDLASPPNARASATGRSRSSLTYCTEVHPNSRTTNPPDILYSAYVQEAPAVDIHQSVPFSVRLQPLVFTYLIRYEFEYGLEYVALARGALGGMAESAYLLDGRTSDETTIILYDCDLKEYGCQAQVRSFGVPSFPDQYFGKASADQTTDRPYTLNLEVRLKNGKYIEYNFDISKQIANQPRGGVITVTGLRVEDEEGSSNTGFDVKVEDWGEREDIDLPVNPTE